MIDSPSIADCWLVFLDSYRSVVNQYPEISGSLLCLHVAFGMNQTAREDDFIKSRPQKSNIVGSHIANDIKSNV